MVIRGPLAGGGRPAHFSRISRSKILPSPPLQRLLGLMLRFIRGASADSVAFMMAANGGYNVENTRPEPARGPAGLLGSEQHYPAEPAPRPAGGWAGGPGDGGQPVRRGAFYAHTLCAAGVHFRGCSRVRQRPPGG